MKGTKSQPLMRFTMMTMMLNSWDGYISVTNNNDTGDDTFTSATSTGTTSIFYSDSLLIKKMAISPQSAQACCESELWRCYENIKQGHSI